MARYQITNVKSGVDLGVYEADDEDGALDAMAGDAGYANFAEACKVAPVFGDEIVVEDLK